MAGSDGIRQIISREQARLDGLKNYFTGEPCLHGHIALRFTSCAICMECNRIKANKQRLKDPDKLRVSKAHSDLRCADRIRRHSALHYQANKVQLLAKNASWRSSNKQRSAALGARWAKQNPDRILASAARWRLAHPDRVRANVTKYALFNPDANRTRTRNRRARIKGSEGHHTAKDGKVLRLSQGDRCAYCLCELKGKGHLDHIQPMARGGSNWPKNLQWLCAPCNLAKNAKDPVDFARQIGLLI